jgi:N12 class adenine-specific DNA methylase
VAKNNFLTSPFDSVATDVEFTDTPTVQSEAPKSTPIPSAGKSPAASPALPGTGRANLPSTDDIIKRAQALDVDPNLALSFFSQESSSNWNGKDSPKGARGGMQVMPGTYKMMMGTDAGQEDPWNNLEAGLRYIRYGQNTLRTRDPELLAAGYHAGYDHPELKKGRIPGTNDGMIATRDYARSVAGRIGKKQPASIADEFTDSPIEQPVTASDFTDSPINSGTVPAATGNKENTPYLERLKTESVEGFGDMTQSLNTARWALGGADDFAVANEMAQSIQNAAKSGKTTAQKEIDAAYQGVSDAEGVIDTTVAGAKALYTSIKNPKETSLEIARSAANSIPSMVGGVAGAGGGALAGAPFGGVLGASAGAIFGGKAGMAAGTTATELGAEVQYLVQKTLEDRKQAPTPENILAILGEKEFKSAALKQGLAKGLTVAAVDQLFMGLGGKIATAPVRQEATRTLAEQGVDVSTKKARDEALASPAGQLAMNIAEPSLGSKVGAGAAAIGVDAAGETLGEGLSQQFARGEVDYGDALREGVASIGQSAVQTAAGVAIERGKQAINLARSTVRPAENAPSTASGPLARASENAAAQPERVTVNAPEGQVSGTVTGTAEDGTMQIVSDDGEIITFKAGENGLSIEPEAPNTPMTNALDVASEETMPASTEQVETPTSAPPVMAEAPTPVAEVQPAVEPKQAEITPPTKTKADQVDYSTMDEPALRERLRYLTEQKKANGNIWTATLIKDRKKVEKAINALAFPETPKAEPVKQPEPALGTNAEGAGGTQPTQVAPIASVESAEPSTASIYANETNKKREKAIDSISKGTAYFGSKPKADEFIASNGLKDTHTVAKGKAGRWDIVAKNKKDGNTAMIDPRAEAISAAAQVLSSGGSDADAARAATDSLIDSMSDSPDISINVEAPAAVKAAKNLQEQANVTNERTSGQPNGAEEVVSKADESIVNEAEAKQDPAKEEVKTSSKVVRTYTTRGGEIGAEITESFNKDGVARYSYTGKWGAGSGMSAEQMGSRESAWKSSKSGFRLSEKGSAAPVDTKPAAAKEESKPEGIQKVRGELTPEFMTAEESTAASKPEDPKKVVTPKESPGTRTNGTIEQKAADRLELLIGAMESSQGTDFSMRSNPETSAKTMVQTSIEELRKAKTAIDVQGILNQASNRLMKKYGAFSKVIDEVAESLGQQDNAAKPEPEVPPPTKVGKPDIFAKNKVFTADKVEASRARMKAKLSQLNSGFDPEMAMDGLVVAGAYIEAGTRTFAAYAKAMTDDFGDAIKPYLLSFYESVRHYPGIENDGMSTPASAQAQHEAMMLDAAETKKAKAKEAPAKTEIKEQPNDTKGNDADYVEPLDNKLPRGNPELATDVATEAGASVRDPNPLGDRRSSRDGSQRRTGVVRGANPILHGPTAEVRPIENGPLNRTTDTPNQLPDGGTGNFQISEADNIGVGTKGQKLRNNMEAIRTLRKVQREGRAATPDEQATMAKFVGWGGLRELIDPNTTGKQWIDAKAELLGTNGQPPLLVGGENGEDWIALQRSITAAHYTAPEIVKSMWSVVEHLGFNGGRALEPTSGIGNFIGLQPQGMAAATEWHGAELDTITGQMAKLIYPEAAIHAGKGFESVPFAKGSFDLAIGNPPFGSLSIKSDVSAYSHIPEMKIHNFIIAKTGEHLRPGGVMAMVVTHRFLDTANPEAREYLSKQFNLLGAFRLPNNAFKANAGTEVVTDIVFLQKLRENEKPAPNAVWLDTEGKITVDGVEIRVNRYFQAHPDHILGRSAMDGTMYGGRGEGEYTVHGDGRDISKSINDIMLTDWARLKDVAKPTNADQDVAAVMLTQSNMPIGSVVLDESGKILKREMDDEAGNAVIKEVTPETLWKDGAERWQAIEKAAKALREGKDFETAALEFIDASAVAYTAKGEKRPKPTKAEQAVYDIRDSLVSPNYQWAQNAQLQEISSTLNRKKLGEDSYKALKGMLGLRATTLKLIAAEMKNAPDMEQLRAALNKEHDQFVAKYGYVSDPANSNLLDGDVGVESGLESGYRPKNGKTKASAKKSDIFSQRVNFPYKEITSAKDAHDGLQISMSERGKLDIAYISGLTRKSKTQVIAELSEGENPEIFFNSETNEYEDADSYLSGNVKRKLSLARENNQTANIKALEAVQPQPKTRDNVKPNIRGSWIPESVFEQFLTDLGVQNAKVNIFASQGMIIAQQSNVRETEFGAQFKSPIPGIVELFNAAASGKPITIWVESPDGKRVKNEAATKEVNLLVERMSKVFEEWGYANDSRVDVIVDAFNEKMNTHIPRKYDGNKYLKTVGATPSIPLRSTQKNGAWRMVQSPTVLLDHVVGAGKTFTIITGVKERKRLGLSRKPLIVVPNHLVTQWAKDFYALYPGAKILAATPDDFAMKKRRRMFSRIATGDYDAVIIGHSSMGFIPAPIEDQELLINENISELQSVLKEMRSKKESGRTLTQIQEMIQKYEGKLKELTESKKDDIGLDFASLGIDYVAVDEMHEFKNLEYSSAGERVVGMNDPKGSKKAFDLYIKLRGVLARGGAVTGATGTPVSNSLVELYTMMKYLAHKDLVERSQLNFDAWSGAYTRTENKLEYTATQKLKPRRVLAGLNNLSALKQLYETFADVISMDDLKRIYAEDVTAKNQKLGTNERTAFPVPKVAGGKRMLDSGPISKAQSLFMDYLVARMNAIERNKSKKKYASIDNPLYVLTDARKMSLDIRIVDPTASRDENGKVARAGERIKDLYSKWDAYKGTQMVFCDLSTPAKNAVKEAKVLIRDSLVKIVGDAEAKRIRARVEAQGDYIKQWRYIETLANDIIDNPLTDPEVADKTATYLASLEDVDAIMTTADVGFSVYDDLRQVLIEKSIPENEIAFIHDYNTPEQKSKLFQDVNDGVIRVLIGSSAKMGAGTNAQQRLVGLHHMDAPWRPSDVEQREGRIIRQGNALYGAVHDFALEKVPADIMALQARLKEENPNGFEVSITAYSTNGTSDAVMWQVLERKSKAIEEFRKTDMDSTVEDEGDANQYAEFMAQSTGNPVFKLKMEAERKVDLLDVETRGLILAKNQAKSFMDSYEKDVAKAQSYIDLSEKANVAAVSIEGQEGTAKEFMDVMAAVEAEYNEKYAAYLEKKDEASKALDAWLAQPEDKRVGDKPKMPSSPGKQNILSAKVQEASGYARAVKAALEKATVTNDFEFQIGNVGLRIKKSPEAMFWTLSIKVGDVWRTYESAISTGADTSVKLASAMAPDALIREIQSIGRSGKTTKSNLESQREVKEKLIGRDIDKDQLEKAKEVAAWYKSQVSFAEQQADELRGKQVNEYIANDTKRPLEQFDSKAKEPKPVQFDGKTYNLTGYKDYNIAQAIDENGQEVIVELGKDDVIEKVIKKPKGIEYSGIKKLSDFSGQDDALFSRNQEQGRMRYIEKNFLDILGELEETGLVKIKC